MRDLKNFLEARHKEKRFVVLDGAVGSEIKKRNPEIAQDETWSGITHLKREDGGDKLVSSIHRDYIDVGAQVHITNTYASNRHVLGGEDLGHLTEEANRVAVGIAKTLIEEEEKKSEKRKLYLAGSMSIHPPRSLAVLKAIRNGEKHTETNITEAVIWPDPEAEVSNYVEQAPKTNPKTLIICCDTIQ